MNTSSIIDLLRADPTIVDDVPGFLKRVNEKNIVRVDKVIRITEQIETLVSYAEEHGGEAVEKDVAYALELLRQEPLLQEAEERAQAVRSAIQSGEVADSAALVLKFGTSKEDKAKEAEAVNAIVAVR